MDLRTLSEPDCLDKLVIRKVRVLHKLEPDLVPRLDVLIVLHRKLVTVLEDLNVFNVKDVANRRVLLEGGQPELRDGREGQIPLCVEGLALEAELLLNGKDLITELIIQLQSAWDDHQAAHRAMARRECMADARARLTASILDWMT